MRCLWIMFVTAVCFLFLLKLKWPKNKNIYDNTLCCVNLHEVMKANRRSKWDSTQENRRYFNCLHLELPNVTENMLHLLGRCAAYFGNTQYIINSHNIPESRQNRKKNGASLISRSLVRRLIFCFVSCKVDTSSCRNSSPTIFPTWSQIQLFIPMLFFSRKIFTVLMFTDLTVAKTKAKPSPQFTSRRC